LPPDQHSEVRDGANHRFEPSYLSARHSQRVEIGELSKIPSIKAPRSRRQLLKSQGHQWQIYLWLINNVTPLNPWAVRSIYLHTSVPRSGFACVSGSQSQGGSVLGLVLLFCPVRFRIRSGAPKESNGGHWKDQRSRELDCLGKRDR
jgi:hypothetical protein